MSRKLRLENKDLKVRGSNRKAWPLGWLEVTSWLWKLAIFPPRNKSRDRLTKAKEVAAKATQ